MTQAMLPAATLVAAIALTYLCCVRPMRQGRCATTSQAASGKSPEQQREQVEIEQARAELAALRARLTTSDPGASPRAAYDLPASNPDHDADQRPTQTSARTDRTG